jgi:tRNA (guanine37-N1)-methyltransferase|tara:strand:+ start:1095 stop:1787 length:693 start_codon:yes stop_codon:yes gene_type:complete
MRIDIITVLPSLLKSPFSDSILKRAQQKGLVEINIHNLRDFGFGKHRQVDDYQFGGGAGMVLMFEPLKAAIESLQKNCSYDEVVYLTPDGKTFNQQAANSLSLKTNLLLICGHYKGIDQRIRDRYITNEISIGDFVLSGGELAAAVLVDSIVRLIPGVLNNETSALTDTFQDDLLAPPVYTRPQEIDGLNVPEILISGNTKLVEDWRLNQSIERTKLLRPDLYDKFSGKK